MTRQREAFLETEGDRWFSRNYVSGDALRMRADADPLLRGLARAGLKPTSVLEIGCSDGWRLERLRSEHGARCAGIDPSSQAVETARKLHPELDIRQGTADAPGFEDGSFDLVILGYCLYLCDREDLFRIAAESDRLLRDGGFVAIYDFHTPVPYRNEYTHRPGLFSYKMDYARMFSWNPVYRLVYQEITAHPDRPGSLEPDDLIGVSILQRRVGGAFPPNPYR